MFINFPHDAKNKVSRSNEGVENMHASISKTFPKILFKSGFHAFNHKIDDWLWRIDYSMRISNLDCKSLKELFIDIIEECLLL